MPLFLMKKLGIKKMKPTKVILQMADKSVRHTHGIVENVLKEETTISPIPAEEEKKKKKPAAYMPKPPYPQRLKAENKNKTPNKEPKEENGATNDSVKFQQIQTVSTIPYLPTIMGSNNKTYMITEGVSNKVFEPP
ncbi:hypothetical protein PIB30_091340 [Stylosanthes scabra]|uniref:Uncharacterized protein n=1 Tax=Stylosanthes scabra TaxID=79078 RepID=A0ABU6YUV5_9FABA|nr:hypothetical protein [Stylosanthes scabra]